MKPATRTILVPRPMTARVGGQPVRDTALLDWLRELVDAVLLEPGQTTPMTREAPHPCAATALVRAAALP